MQMAINESPLESKRKEGLRLAANTVRMTKEYLRKHCKDTKLYLTPNLNDVLYLHFKGFQKIENLDEYTGLKCLWLESNGLGKIENLDHQKELRSLYLHNNLLTKIENLEPLVLLDTINLCHNFICRLENLAVLPALNTLNISHNKLESVDDIKELEKCPTLSVVDLSHNFLKEQLILEVFGAMPCLRVLALTGNPVLKQWSFYRKKLIVACPMLMHLDDRPVFDKDRRCAEAWQEGGLDAEQIMRQTILNEEHLRIRASVDAVLRRRDAATMKRLEEEEERLGDVGLASDNDIVEESTSSESSADSDREDQEIGNELCSSEPEVFWGENQMGVKLRMPWQRDSCTIVDREKKKPLIEEIISEENVDTSKMIEICQLPPKDEICENSNVDIDDKIIVTDELLMTEKYETIVSENIEISQLPITNMLSETCHLNEKDKQNLADNFSKTEKDEEEMLKGDNICKLSSKLEINDKDQGPLTEDLETLENLKDDMLKINEAPIQSTYSTGDSFESCEISAKDEGLPIDELPSDNKYTNETLDLTVISQIPSLIKTSEYLKSDAIEECTAEIISGSTAYKDFHNSNSKCNEESINHIFSQNDNDIGKIDNNSDKINVQNDTDNDYLFENARTFDESENKPENNMMFTLNNNVHKNNSLSNNNCIRNTNSSVDARENFKTKLFKNEGMSEFSENTKQHIKTNNHTDTKTKDVMDISEISTNLPTSEDTLINRHGIELVEKITKVGTNQIYQQINEDKYTNDNFLQDKGVTANLYDNIGIDVEEDKRKVRLEAEQLMKEILEDARRRSNLDMRDDFVMEHVKPKGKPLKYEDVEDYVREFFTVNDTPELKVSCKQNKQTLEKKMHTEGKENISTEGAQKVIKRIELMKESERNENKANGMEVISKIQSARRYLQETVKSIDEFFSTSEFKLTREKNTEITSNDEDGYELLSDSFPIFNLLTSPPTETSLEDFPSCIENNENNYTSVVQNTTDSEASTLLKELESIVCDEPTKSLNNQNILNSKVKGLLKVSNSKINYEPLQSTNIPNVLGNSLTFQKEETRNLADNISPLNVTMDANISEVEQMADSLRNKNKTLPEANQDEMGDTQTKRKEVELKDEKEPVKRYINSSLELRMITDEISNKNK